MKLSIGLQLRTRCTRSNRQLVVVEQLANTVTKLLTPHALVAGCADVIDTIDGVTHGRCWVDGSVQALTSASAELVVCAMGEALLFSVDGATPEQLATLHGAAQLAMVDGEGDGASGALYYPCTVTELNALLLAL